MVVVVLDASPDLADRPIRRPEPASVVVVKNTGTGSSVPVPYLTLDPNAVEIKPKIRNFFQLYIYRSLH